MELLVDARSQRHVLKAKLRKKGVRSGLVIDARLEGLKVYSYCPPGGPIGGPVRLYFCDTEVTVERLEGAPAGRLPQDIVADLQLPAEVEEELCHIGAGKACRFGMHVRMDTGDDAITILHPTAWEQTPEPVSASAEPQTMGIELL